MSCLTSCGLDSNRTEASLGQSLNQIDTSIKDVPKNHAAKRMKECLGANEVSTLGIGLVMPPSKFELFNDSLLTRTYALLDIYSDNKNEIEICSKFFVPEYGIMHFICISITSKTYKVLINFSDTKFIPIKRNYQFKSWEKYILESYGVRRLTNENGKLVYNQPLRRTNNQNSDTLKIPEGHELFCPLEIKGDWLKVQYDCFYNEKNNAFEGEPCHNYIDKCSNPLVGWIKWREKNNLLLISAINS